MIAMPRGAQRAASRSSSCGATNEPVGLLGLTTRTARVRGVSARSTLAKSIDHDPSMSRSTRASRRIEARQVIEQRIARPGTSTSSPASASSLNSSE
jgi:hypothetical protein